MKRRIILRSFGGPLHPVYYVGGTPSSTTSETTSKLDPVLAAQVGPFADFAKNIANKPFTPYKGTLVAGFNQDQMNAFDLGRQGSGAGQQYSDLLSQGPFQGDVSSNENQASSYLSNLLAGQGQTGQETVAADYLTNLLQGGGISQPENQAGDYLVGLLNGQNISGSERSAGTFLDSFYGNQQNPYFEQQLDVGRKRIGEQYSEAIAPQLAGKFALQGAFGGTAQAEAEGRSQRELLRGLGEYETGARSSEQERRYAQGLQAAGLTEQTAGRRAGQGLQAAGQIDSRSQARIQEALSAAGLVEQSAGRRIGQGLQASGLVESNAARLGQQSLQNAQLRAGIIGQSDQAFQNDFTRRLGIGQQEQDLVQKALDAKYGQFQRRIDYPKQTFDIYRDAIAALTGAGGGTQTQNSTSAGGGPGAFQTAAGAATTAAALYALYNAGSTAATVL